MSRSGSPRGTIPGPPTRLRSGRASGGSTRSPPAPGRRFVGLPGGIWPSSKPRAARDRPPTPADLAWTAATGRGHLPVRAGVVFADREGLLDALRRLSQSAVGARPPVERKIAFVFAGEEAARAGFGCGLYETEPVARAVLDRCEAVFREECGESLLALMFGGAADGGEIPLDRFGSVLYAFSAALTALWSSVGVAPDVVSGCGAGELAAAYAAGVFGLADGLRLAIRRDALLAGPGPPEALDEALAAAPAGRPRLPLVRGTDGAVFRPSDRLDAADWRRRALDPARFPAALESLVELGVDVFLGIGPDAHLASRIPGALGDRLPRRAVVVASSRKPDPAAGAESADEGFLDAVGRLYEAGRDIVFEGLFAGERRRRVALPLYPFEQQRHWVEPPRPRRRVMRHPLLGERRISGRGEVTFEAELSSTDPAWLRDFEAFGLPVAPPALFAAQAVCAALSERAGHGVVVEGLEIGRPLLLTRAAPGERHPPGRVVQVVLGAGADGSGARDVHVFSCGLTEDIWIAHATARTRVASDLPEVLARRSRGGGSRRLAPADASAFYGGLRKAGVEVGWSLCSLSELRAGEGAARAEVSLRAAMDVSGVAAHPVLLDGCLQVAAVAAAGADGSAPLVLVGWDRLRLRGPLPRRFECEAVAKGPLAPSGAAVGDIRQVNLRFFDASGVRLGDISGARLRPANWLVADAPPSET